MADSGYSFTFDRGSAEQVFKGVEVRNLVLAVLGGVPPAPDWDGCTVYLGPSPDDPQKTACVGQEGRCADQLQQAMVEAFERLGIRVLQLYEGGPEERQPIAAAHGGRWVGPGAAG
jgi:hypothetical protein